LGQPDSVGCDELVVVVVVLGAVVVVDDFVVVVVLGGAVVVLVALAVVVVLVGVGRWLPHQRPRAEFEAFSTSCGHFHEAATAS
jgi:predicted phage tail protein